ncbi:YheT family hydrolase [Thalassoroseus pseudoceratinae]|uniref:YheT family hydrolase n=1 Tax=Thalassoroseus pseudoceratinae TaxID=2713176 RepID=UPI0014247D79|nr:alpha/beta fold hydrolase [Thalassoroseus pseudoceratinae]
MLPFDASSVAFPAFRSHPFLRNGHLQTIVANLLPHGRHEYTAEQHHVSVSDGDTVVLHDDTPENWQPGDAVAVLVHGLAGCHQSGYMVRTASKLNDRGVRTFRMDLRAAGAGAELAKLPYYAGCSPDVLAVVRYVSKQCGGSPVVLIGYSLGGNAVLKTLGDHPNELPSTVAGAVCVNPAICLKAAAERLATWKNRLYNRFFVRKLWQQICERPHMILPEKIKNSAWRPRDLEQLDDEYTRTVRGFSSLASYYQSSGAGPSLSRIQSPTLVITSDDDPIVPVSLFDRYQRSSSVHVHVTRGGGHLGFLSRSNDDGDFRWMEWRIVEWTLARVAVETRVRRAA